MKKRDCKKLKIESVKKLTFNLGFNTSARYSGLYFDVINKEELFYFFNPELKTDFYFYDENGNQKTNISLKEIYKKNIIIDNINVISIDSLIIKGDYTNMLYVLNYTGKIINEININKIINTGNKTIEYYASWNGDFYKNGNVFFNNYLVNDSSINQKGNKIINSNKRSNLQRKEPYGIFIKNIFKNPQPQKLIEAFYNNFTKKNENLFEFPVYSFNQNKLLAISLYSDSLYVSNLNSEKFETIPIKSCFTRRIKVPLTIINSKEDYLSTQLNFKQNNCIGDIINLNNKITAVCVYQKRKTTSNGELIGTPDNFNLIFLDKNYNKIGENLIPTKKYKEGSIKTTNKGLIVLEVNTENAKDYEPNNKKYEILNLNY